jgi:tRNA pseudouridine55 synthase
MLDINKIPLVFNVYKPVGKSSFFPVHIFKRNLAQDYGKIGHFGTLDPFADGVLLVGIQGAQKINDYVHQFLTKTYEAEGCFGIKTSSGDISTDVIERMDINEDFRNLSALEIEQIIVENFLGEYWQAPHSISASKFQGKRLYKHALEGRIIVKDKVKRDILKLNVLEFNYPILRFSIEVSSGTYIRSFFEDIAGFFGGVGSLNKLTRTKIGPNKIENSLKVDQWPQKGESFDLALHGVTIDKIFRLHEFHLEDYSARKYLQGQRCPLTKVEKVLNEGAASENIFWIYSNGNLLGMGKIENEHRIAIVFNLPAAIEYYS